jgi:hypothetical protein
MWIDIIVCLSSSATGENACSGFVIGITGEDYTQSNPRRNELIPVKEVNAQIFANIEANLVKRPWSCIHSQHAGLINYPHF